MMKVADLARSNNLQIGRGGSALTQNVVKRVGKLKYVAVRHVAGCRDNLVFHLIERGGVIGGRSGRKSLTHLEFSSKRTSRR